MTKHAYIASFSVPSGLNGSVIPVCSANETAIADRAALSVDPIMK